MHGLLQDLRFAQRTLRRRPTFAVVTIATIALGIAAATSAYSVVDGILLRPRPFREPGRLVAVWQTYPEWKKDPILHDRGRNARDHRALGGPYRNANALGSRAPHALDV